MKSFNNRSQILKDDLVRTIKDNSSISIAAACFSMYAYEALRTELSKTKDFRFIFNSPAFIADQIPKEKREFFIPRLNRERSIYGTQFEVRLRNELTQKAIAKEQSYFAVFRNAGFNFDSAAANFEQLFNTYSPSTERKVL